MLEPQTTARATLPAAIKQTAQAGDPCHQMPLDKQPKGFARSLGTFTWSPPKKGIYHLVIRELTKGVQR